MLVLAVSVEEQTASQNDHRKHLLLAVVVHRQRDIIQISSPVGCEMM